MKLTVNKHSKKVKTISVLGILHGIFTFFTGVLVLFLGSPYAESSLPLVEFGADFYTDIYEGVYIISEQLEQISRNIISGTSVLHLIFIAFGFFEIIFFSYLFCDNNRKIEITVDPASLPQLSWELQRAPIPVTSITNIAQPAYTPYGNPQPTYNVAPPVNVPVHGEQNDL